jgi:hypothetical protein
MPVEIIICIAAGCAVAIFSGMGKSEWRIFREKSDERQENDENKS